jgi:hypothetical protein
VPALASRPAAYGICVWSLLFAVPHVYWALGGRVGLAASAGSETIVRDVSFVVIGLWGTTALCAAGVLFGLALARPWGDIVPRWLLFLDASGASVLFLLRFAVVELSTAGYVLGLRSTAAFGPTQWAELHSYVYVWSPYFLLGSLLFGVAAWQLHRRGHAR